jgi:hypothetical protein
MIEPESSLQVPVDEEWHFGFTLKSVCHEGNICYNPAGEDKAPHVICVHPIKSKLEVRTFPV